MKKILEILEMDGRKRAPQISILGTVPGTNAPSISSVRSTIKHFERVGSTTHSTRRLLLPYVVAYCEAKGYAYSIHSFASEDGHRGLYTVKREYPFRELGLPKPIGGEVVLQDEPEPSQLSAQ